MFYILLFSGIAILCIVAGATAMTRNRRKLDEEDARERASRRKRK